MAKHNYRYITISVHLYASFCKWYFRTHGCNGGTCQRAISGINATLQWLGYGINLHNRNSEPIVRIAKAIDNIKYKYKIGKRRVYRRAMVNAMLDVMLQPLNRRNRLQRVLRATILFEKQTGFRAHNVVMTKHGGFVRIRHLAFYPSVQHPTHLIVTLPHGKTRPKHSPTPETRTLQCRCKVGFCAVHEVAALVKHRMNKTYQAVFLMPNGSPVTYRTLLRILKLLCELFGLEPCYYTSHALRFGQATDLHMSGMSIPRVMKWMGWESQKSAMKYIRPDNADFVKFGISVKTQPLR